MQLPSGRGAAARTVAQVPQGQSFAVEINPAPGQARPGFDTFLTGLGIAVDVQGCPPRVPVALGFQLDASGALATRDVEGVHQVRLYGASRVGGNHVARADESRSCTGAERPDPRDVHVVVHRLAAAHTLAALPVHQLAAHRGDALCSGHFSYAGWVI